MFLTRWTGAICASRAFHPGDASQSGCPWFHQQILHWCMGISFLCEASKVSCSRHLKLVCVLRAGGFASSQLLKSRSGLAPGEESTINPQQNEELKAELVGRAAAVRDIMGVAPDRGIALREVLKGGVLAGQAVYFQSRHGPILNKGEPAVDANGHLSSSPQPVPHDYRVRSALTRCKFSLMLLLPCKSSGSTQGWHLASLCRCLRFTGLSQAMQLLGHKLT